MKPQKAATPEATAPIKRSGPHPVDTHVGSRVKLRRMILGLSQEAIGAALGLTFQQIQKYEKGVNRIGASRMFELSRLLKVPVQFFYDDFPVSEAGGDYAPAPSAFAEDSAPPPVAGAAVMALVNSPEGVQLCRYFSAIKDPDVKKRVLELVRSIADTENGPAA